eukprot:10709296-Ditylum_brightwellii.AAC.1
MAFFKTARTTLTLGQRGQWGIKAIAVVTGEKGKYVTYSWGAYIQIALIVFKGIAVGNDEHSQNDHEQIEDSVNLQEKFVRAYFLVLKLQRMIQKFGQLTPWLKIILQDTPLLFFQVDIFESRKMRLVLEMPLSYSYCRIGTTKEDNYSVKLPCNIDKQTRDIALHIIYCNIKGK